MCGIAGIINFNGQPVEKADLKLMTDAIQHRGPDGEGFYLHEHVGFGHRRLAIIDLSNAGAQPMTRFGCTITYNGEIYNYIEVKKELEKKGISFTTKTDTEVILAAYHVWGTECVKRFNGMWAFAIHDVEKHQVFCSRDRFGEKPFYYYKSDSQFIFSSEIKGILAIGIPTEANLQSVVDFMVQEQVECDENTFYKHIRKLLPAHQATLCLNTSDVSIKRYFSFIEGVESDTYKQYSSTDWFELIANQLKQTVHSKLISDVNVGTCLSAGVDSTLVCSNAFERVKHTQGYFTAVTGGLFDQDLDESAVAKQTAAKLGMNWVCTKPRASDLIRDFEQIIFSQEEPFVSPSICLQYFVMKAANNAKIKVLLDGQGADELFLGYTRYLPAVFKHMPWSACCLNMPRLLRNCNVTWYSFLQLKHYYSKYRFRFKYRKHKWERNLQPSAFLLVNGQFANSQASAFKKSLFDFQLFELEKSSLPSLLRYEDKNAMAFSIETRLPYLDHHLASVALKMPLGIRLNQGWTKFPLRKELDANGFSAVAWHKIKRGYEITDDFWLYQTSFQKNLIDKSELLKKVLKKPSGTFEREAAWRLMTIAAWEQKFSVI